MRRRKKLRLKTSKKIFRRNAKVHKMNRPHTMRGGIRL